MKVLLFFLGISFFLIFFLFSLLGDISGSVLENIFIEANIYVFLSICFIFVVFRSDFSLKRKTEKIESEKIIQINIKELVGDFFSNYIYYIAGVFFYVSIYFILLAFFPNIDIGGLFLFMNLVVLILYFIESDFPLFQDFIGVNIVVIAFYYVLRHIALLMGYIEDFSYLEILNIIFLFIFFIIVLYHKKSFSYVKIVEYFFLGFLFLELIFLLRIFGFSGISPVGITAFFLGFGVLIFTDPINNIAKIQKQTLRSFGVIFLLISTLLSVKVAIFPPNIYYLPIFLLSSIILCLFHKRFQNYVALTGGIFGITIFINLLFLLILGEKGDHLLYCIYFGISILLLFEKIKEYISYSNDHYAFHIYSLLVNLVGVLLFFILNDFSILSLGILFLFESVYLFSSYYILSKKI